MEKNRTSSRCVGLVAVVSPVQGIEPGRGRVTGGGLLEVATRGWRTGRWNKSRGWVRNSNPTTNDGLSVPVTLWALHTGTTRRPGPGGQFSGPKCRDGRMTVS